ncbi:hypothetical protein OG417_50975 [Actinoallomurus sp. NBC_01490]|jgi:hypothetical protein|uniref:hypothetical protein n=1 Tax=Actinoallomurus sp. NBC_01490 TaxID=2903557 RepID=UPI002E377611|nr:hypothetical protein [Actinoallomurus sp. NBC_01490]
MEFSRNDAFIMAGEGVAERLRSGTITSREEWQNAMADACEAVDQQFPLDAA